jgi:Zn-dependent membrane protease YugP
MYENPMMGAYVIGGLVMLVSWLVGQQLRSRFAKYSQTPLSNGMTGREIAERMLHDNGIFNVKVISVPGQLTDHYNPANRTVNLSEAVYHQRNAAAAAVAAHEVGHAVQHATAYQWLTMRSKLVPVVSVAHQHVPAAAPLRHHPVRGHHLVQRHHPAGGIRRQQPCIGLDETARRGHPW